MKIRRFNENNTTDDIQEINNILNIMDSGVNINTYYVADNNVRFAEQPYLTQTNIIYHVDIEERELKTPEEYIEYYKNVADILERLNTSFDVKDINTSVKAKSGFMLSRTESVGSIEIIIDSGFRQEPRFQLDVLKDFIHKIKDFERYSYWNGNTEELALKDSPQLRDTIGFQQKSMIQVKYLEIFNDDGAHVGYVEMVLDDESSAIKFRFINNQDIDEIMVMMQAFKKFS